MTIPSPAPITIDRKSPAPARHSEAAPLVMSSPSLSSSIQAATTILSGGNASVDTRPVRAPTSHASASNRSGRYRRSAAFTGGAPSRPRWKTSGFDSAAARKLASVDGSRSSAPLSLDRLDPYQIPDLV